MPDPTDISLARALKLKNRVVHRLNQIDAILVANNSQQEGNHEYDVKALYRQRLEVAMKLVELKAAISAANGPVQKQIFELAECKSHIALLARIDTKHGTSVEGYSGTPVKYVAILRKQEIDRERRQAEAEIDRIQNELDAFNHQTTIPVDPALLTNEGG